MSQLAPQPKRPRPHAADAPPTEKRSKPTKQVSIQHPDVQSSLEEFESKESSTESKQWNGATQPQTVIAPAASQRENLSTLVRDIVGQDQCHLAIFTVFVSQEANLIQQVLKLFQHLNHIIKPRGHIVCRFRTKDPYDTGFQAHHQVILDIAQQTPWQNTDILYWLRKPSPTDRTVLSRAMEALYVFTRPVILTGESPEQTTPRVNFYYTNIIATEHQCASFLPKEALQQIIQRYLKSKNKFYILDPLASKQCQLLTACSGMRNACGIAVLQNPDDFDQFQLE